MQGNRKRESTKAAATLKQGSIAIERNGKNIKTQLLFIEHSLYFGASWRRLGFIYSTYLD